MENLKLIPTGKDYIWGGTRLKKEYSKKLDLTPLAETWEYSAHPDESNTVANGTYKGKTLAEVLKFNPEYFGSKCKNGELPIFVKFIDSKKISLYRFTPITSVQKSMSIRMARRKCGM